MKKTLLISFIITGVCFGQTYDHIEFYDDGISPKVIRTYKQSRNKLNDLVLETRWYENGQKQLEITAKDGILDGKITKWHENGQKALEGTYKDGQQFGKYTRWYDNGQKKSEGTCKGMTDSFWRACKNDGKYTGWHENGQIESEGTYKDGQQVGDWTQWHDNGQIESEGTYNDGKRDGKLTHWYDDGQKGVEAIFIDGELVDSKCWQDDGNECICEDFDRHFEFNYPCEY